MESNLQELRATLIRGIRLSKQSAYDRRAPEPDAVPFLEEARDGLREFVQAHPESADGWRTLAQAEECFLEYGEAYACLERAMSISGERKPAELRRLAHYKEQVKEWGKLLLTPDQLRCLGVFLRDKLRSEPSGKTFRWTEQWLGENHFQDVAAVIESLRARGAYDDFQVSENLAWG